jgi:pimeloyl-ACP methyl ester carboxylesterase
MTYMIDDDASLGRYRSYLEIAFAARDPERVRRMVLIAPAGLPAPPEHMARFLSRSR